MGGKRRLDLGIVVTQISALSQMLGDEKFTSDFNDYLSLVEYDVNQIAEERKKVIQKTSNNPEYMSIISGNKR